MCARASFFFFFFECCLLHSLSLYSVLSFFFMCISIVCVCVFLNKQRPYFGLLKSLCWKYFYSGQGSIGDGMIHLVFLSIMGCDVMITIFLSFYPRPFCSYRTVNQSASASSGLDEDKTREGRLNNNHIPASIYRLQATQQNICRRAGKMWVARKKKKKMYMK